MVSATSADGGGSFLGNATIAAGVFTVAVAVLGTVYQATHGHNENRRKSYWESVGFVADAVAAARLAVVALATASRESS